MRYAVKQIIYWKTVEEAHQAEHKPLDRQAHANLVFKGVKNSVSVEVLGKLPLQMTYHANKEETHITGSFLLISGEEWEEIKARAMITTPRGCSRKHLYDVIEMMERGIQKETIGNG